METPASFHSLMPLRALELATCSIILLHVCLTRQCLAAAACNVPTRKLSWALVPFDFATSRPLLIPRGGGLTSRPMSWIQAQKPVVLGVFLGRGSMLVVVALSSLAKEGVVRDSCWGSSGERSGRMDGGSDIANRHSDHRARHDTSRARTHCRQHFDWRIQKQEVDSKLRKSPVWADQIAC